MGRAANEIDKWGWMVLSDSEGAPGIKVKIKWQNQGPRSYFESLGGRGRGGADKWLKEWGGKGWKHFFSATFYNFQNSPPAPPPPQALRIEHVSRALGTPFLVPVPLVLEFFIIWFWAYHRKA